MTEIFREEKIPRFTISLKTSLNIPEKKYVKLKTPLTVIRAPYENDYDKITTYHQLTRQSGLFTNS